MLDRNSKIYVAGHRGLVGSAIWNNLLSRGYTNLVGRTHSELDLTDQYAVERFFDEEKPDAVVLAAAFLGIRQYNKNALSATSITEDTQETVLDVNSDDITSFRYVYEGETYAFEKEDDTWYYADDHSLNLNQDRIKAMILKVAPLKADQVIENVTDMSQYGLADPERTIQYETADRSVIINVGNLNSMTSQYYIAFPSEMKVYVVATNVVTGFNYTLEDLVEETTEAMETAETETAATEAD